MYGNTSLFWYYSHMEDMEQTAQLLTDSQDLQALSEYFPNEDWDEITGALVEIGEGEYTSVKVTESSTPYLTDAYFRTIL